MQINNLLVNTPKIQYSVPNFCASKPIKKQDNHINSDTLDNGTEVISRAEIEIQKKIKEQQEIDKLLNSMTKLAKEKNISKNYLTEIVNACKNEDETLNKNAMHLANHFMKSGMNMNKRDNILGTIEFCKDKNGFSKQMGSIIENYIDIRMKPEYSCYSNKFSQHLNGDSYFNSNNPIKNKDGVFDKDCMNFLYRYSKVTAWDDITSAASVLYFLNPLVNREYENENTREFKKLMLKNEKFLYSDKYIISDILNVAKSCNKPEHQLILNVLKRVIKDDEWTPGMIQDLCINCKIENEDGENLYYLDLFKLYDNLLKDKMLPAGLINSFVAKRDIFTPENIDKWYKDEESQSCIKDVEALKQHMIKNHSLYMNDLGQSSDFSNKFSEIWIKDFFSTDYNYQTLIHFVGIFDRKTLDVLMRKRLADAQEFINVYATIPDIDRNIIAELAYCKNIDGREFTSQEKIHFIDLVNAYRQNHISTKNIAYFIDLDNDIFDINSANLLLINKVLKKCGLTNEEIESIPQEKLDAIDINNIHLFIETLREDKSGAGKDLLKVMLTKDFDSYIQDKTNKYGYSNSLTEQEFKTLGLNYKNWINADKELEVRLQSGHVNGQSIDNIAEQLNEDIKAMRKSPIGGFFDKQFKKYIIDGEFNIPKEISTNEKNLGKFVEEILTRLEPAKDRAKRNFEMNSSETAQNTLTLINHLEQRLKDIEALDKIPTDKKLDVTVKMWDRDPIKDIYQGNYSTCCLSMGSNTNGEALFNYLLNTAFNMIEIVDNKSNNVIGNALCYFTKDKNNNPAFIVDNIEINNKHKLSDESSIMLRDKIKEYAQNIVSSICENDVPIYLGTNYNDVATEDLNKTKEQMKFVGNITNKEIYLDLYNGWNNKNKLDKSVEIFEL